MDTLEFEGTVLNADKHSFIDYGKYFKSKEWWKSLGNISKNLDALKHKNALLSRDVELEIENLKSQGFKFHTGEAVI